MNKLKCYVGLGNRFVLCERFPDDEEHAGLHDMLQEWIDTCNPFRDNIWELEDEKK